MDSFSQVEISLPENIKFNTVLWEFEVPDGLEGTKITFASALLDGKTREVIGDVSIEKVAFVE